MGKAITIYFATDDRDVIRRIREHFGMPVPGLTINGETVCDADDGQLAELAELSRRGLIQIRNKTIKPWHE